MNYTYDEWQTINQSELEPEVFYAASDKGIRVKDVEKCYLGECLDDTEYCKLIAKDQNLDVSKVMKGSVKNYARVEDRAFKIVGLRLEKTETTNSTYDLEDYKIIRDSFYDLEVFEAGIACDILVENIEEAYNGEFNSDEEFAQDMAENTGSIPDNTN